MQYIQACRPRADVHVVRFMNTNLLPPDGRNHIAWVDLLRIVACFLVVLAHCCDPFVGNFSDKTDFMSGALWGSFVRPCVPLFAMISGVLLFPVKMDMRTFYARRLKRVVIPLVVWSLALPLMYYAYFATGVQTSSPNIVMDSYTWSATAEKLYLFLFNFNYDTTPLWYLYMLVGLYLFMPIMGAWLNQAPRKDVKLFLWIWGVSMVLPVMQVAAPFLGYEGNYGSMGLLGVCLWNPYGMLYNFAGFMGYMVLGHYLVKYPLDWSWAKTWAISLLLLGVGYAVSSIGFFEMQKYFPGDYANLEIPWYFSGINVFMMTFAMFSLLSKVRVKGSRMMSRVAELTFGIYLCHFVLVQCSYDFVKYLDLPVPGYVQIPVIAVIAFLISLALVWVLSLTRLTRRSIM